MDQLIRIPEKVPNVSKSFKAASDGPASFSYNKASSAYKDIFSSSCLTLRPLTAGDYLIKIASGSRARAKREGDKGHPCLVPLQRANMLDSQSFVRIRALGAR